MANYGLFGEATFSFKLTNLMLHIFCGIGLYIFGKQLMQAVRGVTNNQATIAALVTAIAWLLHPLQVSTVLYVVQRMAQFSMLFMIMGMLVYVLGRKRMLAGHGNGLLLCTLGIAFFTPPAALSKETGLLLPFFVLLIEVVIFRFEASCEKQKKTLIAVVLMLCVAPMLYGAWYFVESFDKLMIGYDVRDFTLTERLMTQIHVIYFYMGLVFVPDITSMGLYHDDFPVIRAFGWMTGTMLSGLMFIVALAVLLSKRLPLFTLGVLWFFLAHAVESSFLPLEMVFEHRNYMAVWGLLLPTIYYGQVGLSKLGNKLQVEYLGYLAVISLICIMSLLAFFRAAGWKDQATFVYGQYVDHPDSRRALIGMSALHLGLNSFESARDLISKAESIGPTDPGLQLFRLYTYCNDRPPPAALISETRASIAQGNWSIYANQMLYSLYIASNKRQCEYVNGDTLLDLINTAIYRRPIPSRYDSLELHLAHAGLLSDMGYFERAYKYYQYIYNNTANLPPKTKVAILKKLKELSTISQLVIENGS
ncbi:MAG: hypothetical protein AB1421_03015 [Pseudomonadota bacterium]